MSRRGPERYVSFMGREHEGECDRCESWAKCVVEGLCFGCRMWEQDSEPVRVEADHHPTRGGRWPIQLDWQGHESPCLVSGRARMRELARAEKEREALRSKSEERR